jgi:histidinol-phosphate phosphatase family protein
VSFAVFLDRDGTIVADKHFLFEPDDLELLPNAVEGLRALRRLGARLVVVTNQSGVGRGYFDEAAVERVNRRLLQLLADHGVELDGIFVCPHAPDEGCDCRKPAPGLFRRAAAELGVDLTRSFVIGDRDVDVRAGRGIGATSILIGLDGTADPEVPHAPNLLAAARLVRQLLSARPA